MARSVLSRPAAAKAEEQTDRRGEILAVAAELFAQRGYEGVSVRQIADAVGMLGGSLYHHFASKRDIYIEAHAMALTRALTSMQEAIVELDDPWDRLEAAARVHLAAQLDPDSLTLPMMSDVSAMSSDMRKELVKERDRFEAIYKQLVADLPLRADIDRNIYRLCLVSLINTVPVWFRPGRLTVDEVAAQIAMIFRDSSDMSMRRVRALYNGSRGRRAGKPATRRPTQG